MTLTHAPGCICEFCLIQRLGEQKRKLQARIEELELIKAELRDRLNKPCPACGVSLPRSKP